MKKEYDIFITIKNNSGFGWDSEKGVPTAPESVWDAYIKAHPEGERFRHRGLVHYAVLDELCANRSATGEFALTSGFTAGSTTSTLTSKSAGNDHVPQDPKWEGRGRSSEQKGERERSTSRASEQGKEIRGNLWEEVEGEENQEGRGHIGGKRNEVVGKRLERGKSEEGEASTGVEEMGPKELLMREGKRVKIEGIGGGYEVRGQGIGKKKVIRKRKIKEEVKEGGKRQKRNAGRGREKEDEEEEEDDGYGQGKREEGSQGGIRRERKSAGKAIAAALDRIGTTAQSIQRSKTELAIQKLQDEYGLVLPIEDLVKAFQLMENEVKASVFIALQDGSARDRWLAESLDKM